MATVARTGFVLLACLLTVSVAQDGPKETTDADADKAAMEKFRAYAKDVASAYELHAGGSEGRKLTFLTEPILRWSNPVGNQQARGEIYLWTVAGVPAAIVSINEFTNSAGKTFGEQEWSSLLDGPLTATGPHRWSPATGLLSRQQFGDAPKPAESATQRRRQMSDLAGHFTGEKVTRAGITRPLRLLPKPLYRYESKHDDVLDGALFALAEATDPEVLLLIEARNIGSRCVWHYAFARMNSVLLTASYDDKKVWEAAEVNGTEVYDRQDQAYTAFLRK